MARMVAGSAAEEDGRGGLCSGSSEGAEGDAAPASGAGTSSMTCAPGKKREQRGDQRRAVGGREQAEEGDAHDVVNVLEGGEVGRARDAPARLGVGHGADAAQLQLLAHDGGKGFPAHAAGDGQRDLRGRQRRRSRAWGRARR